MSRHSYNTELASCIANVMDTNGWNYHFVEDKGIFCFTFELDSRLESAAFTLHVQQTQYVLYATLPLAAPIDDPERLQRMCQFTVCANYGLPFGNFEMDMRDGELRFHTYADCDDGVLPSDKIVCNGIHISLDVLERYSDAILEVLFGDTARSVADIVETSERGQNRRISQILLEQLTTLGEIPREELHQMIVEAGGDLPPEEEDDEEDWEDAPGEDGLPPAEDDEEA